MALSASDLRLVLKRLADKTFQTSQERDQLLAQLATADGLKAKDLAWMLFRPDRAYRDAVLPILKRVADPETADAVIGESRGKPEAAVRAAAASLFSLGLPGTERRIAEIGVQGKGEAQEVARRLLLDAPPSPALEPVLWHLATTGRVEERLAYLGKLAGAAARREVAAALAAPRARPGEGAAREGARRARSARRGRLGRPVRRAAPARGLHDAAGAGRGADTRGRQPGSRVRRPHPAADRGGRGADPLGGAEDPARHARPPRRGAALHPFSKSLAGWARDRALESMRAFGNDLLEPTIELLSDPDEEVRGSAMLVAQSFEDPRIVPATIGLLKDPDWWIRITAAETLGRLKDPRGVQPLMEALSDPETRWSAVEALGRIGDLRAAPALSQLLQDPAPEVRIEVIQALSHFNHPQMLDFVTQRREGRPVARGARARVRDHARDGRAAADQDGRRGAAEAARARRQVGRRRAQAQRAPGRDAQQRRLRLPPRRSASRRSIRLAADLVRAQGEPFTPQQTEAMLREILTEAQWQRVQQERQLDFCHYIPRPAATAPTSFIDQKGMNGVFRVIPERPPTISEIGLPPHLAEIADYHQGLVLVCGPSGSGKSTTLAALVNLFNETRHDHVLTMEDPVEFVHPFKNCLINQREVGHAHAVVRARAARGAARGPGRDRDRRAARQRERLARAHRRRDRPHRAGHAQLHLRARRRSTAFFVQLPGRRAGPDPRVAVRVAQVRDRAAAAAVEGAEQAGGGVRGAARHGGRRQHDPRREDVPDPLGDADRPVAGHADLRRRAQDLVTRRQDQRRDGYLRGHQERGLRGLPARRRPDRFPPRPSQEGMSSRLRIRRRSTASCG